MTKIFLVDDDEFILRMYERVFRFADYETETAKDGDEALSLLEKMETLPDAIAIDAVMPKITGLQLLEKIRASEKIKNIPVVVLTNSISKKDAGKFFELGASSYLIKMENDPKEVVKKIEEVIKKKKK